MNVSSKTVVLINVFAAAGLGEVPLSADTRLFFHDFSEQ